MGMDLTFANDEWVRMSFGAWAKLLTLADEKGGWKPLGTERPDLGPDMIFPGEWKGGYGSNDFQRVTDEDARNLADALERVLADSKGEYETHTGMSVAWIREFIAKCRAGGFIIG